MNCLVPGGDVPITPEAIAAQRARIDLRMPIKSWKAEASIVLLGGQT